jgi:hypothetical protein
MEVGDYIICIDPKEGPNLTFGKKYKIIEINEKLFWCTITNDINETQYYILIRFITLDEWREKQLNKIL